jgi:short-subunit dehydrogenase
MGVTVTALMPGATDTDFRRTGMLERGKQGVTRLGESRGQPGHLGAGRTALKP